MAVPEGQFSTLKLHLTYEQQLALLQARGMTVADEPTALEALQRIGYYRLAGYCYPLRKTNPHGARGRQDEFQPGTSFELVEALYEFDRELRLLVLDAVERIEVAIRVDVGHRLGRRHRLAHEAPSVLDGKFTTQIDPRTNRTRYDEWLCRLRETVRKAKGKEDFVDHHFQRYGGKMPIWVITELWEFGQLSKFFAGIQHRDQAFIAKRYGLPQGAYLASWLRAFNFVRNVAAHHGRLWNRNIVDRPKLPDTQPHHHLHHVRHSVEAQTRVYGILCLLRVMLRTIAPASEWSSNVKAVAHTFPASPHVSLANAGFPVDWREKAIWA